MNSFNGILMNSSHEYIAEYKAMSILDSDLNEAICTVVSSLPGINNLYEGQVTLLTHLLNGENIFYTSPTNSGKTIPPVILPSIVKELGNIGYNIFPKTPRVLFVTALNIEHG